MKKFLNQFKKINSEPMEKANIFWSWVGSFLGIFSVAYINYDILNDSDLSLIVGSFGASAVLIYGAINSPLSQPRNLIGGHILSAIVGVISFKLFGEYIWFCPAFAVATSILVMQLTLTLHPPGGATALIAVIGSEEIHNLGFIYVFIPIATGAFVLFVIAFLINNISKDREYPIGFKQLNKKWFSDD